MQDFLTKRGRAPSAFINENDVITSSKTIQNQTPLQALLSTYATKLHSSKSQFLTRHITIHKDISSASPRIQFSASNNHAR